MTFYPRRRLTIWEQIQKIGTIVIYAIGVATAIKLLYLIWFVL